MNIKESRFASRNTDADRELARRLRMCDSDEIGDPPHHKENEAATAAEECAKRTGFPHDVWGTGEA